MASESGGDEQQQKEEEEEEELAGRPLVALCGDGRDTAFLVDLRRDGIEVCEKTIRVADGTNQSKDDTGEITWDGALILAKLMSKSPFIVRNHAVFELGAGTGLCGLAAAAAGASKVIITDLPYCMGRIRANVALNAGLLEREKVVVDVLDWSESKHRVPDLLREHGQPQVVLCCECVWRLDIVAPFLDTLSQLLPSAGIQSASMATEAAAAAAGAEGSGPGKGDNAGAFPPRAPYALVAYYFREKEVDQAMRSGLAERNIVTKPVTATWLDEEFADDGYDIFFAYRQ